MKPRIAAVLLSWLCAVIVTACSKEPEPDFVISNLVIREMPPGREVAVAYLTIENLSDQALTFNYVHSPRAQSIEVHQHLHENGKMLMREVKHYAVAPKSRVDFVPRGYHLMLFGVNTRFTAGEYVDLTFEFENRAPLTLVAEVKKL